MRKPHTGAALPSGRGNSAGWRGRWILTGFLLAVVLGAAGVAASSLPKAYQAGAAVVLLASRNVARTSGGNPYLSFSPSLTLTADVVSRELMAPGTAAGLAARGFADSYTVALPTYTTNTTGSVLLVTVTGKDAPSVEQTLHGVLAQVRATLARIQAGVTANSRVRLVTLSADRRPTMSKSRTIRPLVLVIGLSLAVAFGLPWIVEAQILQLRARRARRAQLTQHTQLADAFLGETKPLPRS